MNPRPLSAVMDAAVRIVPDSCTLKPSFIEGVEDIKSSIPYTAPEAMWLRWEDFILLLTRLFGDVDAPWNETLKLMVNAKLDYKEFLDA